MEETPDIAEADISTSDTDVNTNIVDFEVSESANPISAMNDAAGETTPVNTTDSDKIIALIDTGASESANIIERVSLIDDVMVGSNSHGDDMVKAIVSQNENAKIISIRALGDDGQGTVSSIIAGIEYAINQKADIINLSLYARANLANEVVKTEIEKAINNGIEVVGAAGNDCANAKNYIPGSIDAAWIIGACDESGFRISFSNYGETVDYNVIAKSTSEAAAKFSGYISKFGTKDINFNKSELVNNNDDDSENVVLESDIFKTADDPLPYETKVLLIDYHNGKDSELPSGWQSGVGYTAANEMKAHFYKTRADKNSYMASASDTNDSDDFAYALRFSFCIEPGKTYSNYGEHDKVVRLDNRTGNNARRMTKAVFYLFGGPAFDVNATTADGKKHYNFKSIPLLKQGESTKATTDATGYIAWQNLDQGEYQITETKTISGNTLLKDPINITLPITMTDKQAKDMSAATDNGQFDDYTNKWYFYEATFEVTNSVKFIMPTTGANGVWRFIFFGFGTMAVLTTGLVVYDARNKRTRKRRRK